MKRSYEGQPVSLPDGRNTPYAVVTEPTALRRLVEELLADDAVAVDTESDQRHHYPGRVSLIQLGTERCSYLIDPLAVADLSPLAELFRRPSTRKIFHAASMDLAWLDRDFGFRLTNVYDTSVGAGLLGYEQAGLSTLVFDFLQVPLEKPASLQKADWSKRPLGKQMLEYAAGDVRYLIPLMRAQEKRLHELGRLEWLSEECLMLEQLCYVPADPETEHLKVKGVSQLNETQLRTLRTLFGFRERIALRQGRAPAYFLTAEALIALSKDPALEPSGVPGLNGWVLRTRGRELRSILRGAAFDSRSNPSGTGPTADVAMGAGDIEERKLRRVTFRAALTELLRWRRWEAENMSVSPELVWPRRSLERLASGQRDLSAESSESELRRWQVSEFSERLGEAMRRSVNLPKPNA
jgi:ribonuclease D